MRSSESQVSSTFSLRSCLVRFNWPFETSPSRRPTSWLEVFAVVGDLWWAGIAEQTDLSGESASLIENHPRQTRPRRRLFITVIIVIVNARASFLHLNQHTAITSARPGERRPHVRHLSSSSCRQWSMSFGLAGSQHIAPGGFVQHPAGRTASQKAAIRRV